MDSLFSVKRNKKKKKNSPSMSETLCDKLLHKDTFSTKNKASQSSKHNKRKNSLILNSNNQNTKFKKYKKKNKLTKNAKNIDFISIPSNLKLLEDKSERAVNFKISDELTPTFSDNDDWYAVKKTNKINLNKKSCEDRNMIKKKRGTINKITAKNKIDQNEHQYLNDNLSIPLKVEKISKKFKKLSSSLSRSCTPNEKLKSVMQPNLTKKLKKENTTFKKSSTVKKREKFKVNSDPASSDSEEDQTIRNELKNLPVFNNIQELLKKQPTAYANFENVFDSDESSNQEMNSLISNRSESLSSQCSADFLDDSSKTVEKNHSKKLKETKRIIVSDSKKSETDCVTSKYSENNFMRAGKYENFIQKNDKNLSEKLKPCKNKAREKLQAAKFRFLNEKLYTESGKDSFTYFQKNKDEFLDYHIGYKLQITKWPLNPVDKIIKSLQNIDKNLIIADMGCGDAKIAQTLHHSVHSFDLVSLNEYVTSCNISKVPLKNESVDVVVFCLSLMGTDLQKYLQEAYRILKISGSLKIAEVVSRISDLDNFIKSIHSIGFTIQQKDVEHKLFVFLEFKKEKGRKRKREKKKKKATQVEDIVLKPCLYKKR